MRFLQLYLAPKLANQNVVCTGRLGTPPIVMSFPATPCRHKKGDYRYFPSPESAPLVRTRQSAARGLWGNTSAPPSGRGDYTHPQGACVVSMIHAHASNLSCTHKKEALSGGTEQGGGFREGWGRSGRKTSTSRCCVPRGRCSGFTSYLNRIEELLW